MTSRPFVDLSCPVLPHCGLKIITLWSTKTAKGSVRWSICNHHLTVHFDIFEIVTIERTYNMPVTNTHRKILTVTNIQIYVT